MTLEPEIAPIPETGSVLFQRLREKEFTTGDWATEIESAAAFDAAVPTDLFKVHREVRGTLMSPRPAQTDRSMRIDRVLLPTDYLISLGWQFGIVGCEIKKSGAKIGPAIAQATDYSRTAWQLGPYRVLTDYTFIWPMAKQGGTIASILAQNCIGSANVSRYVKFQLMCGEVPILHVDPYGTVRVGKRTCGARAGSR
jgi:hypothetical protein